MSAIETAKLYSHTDNTILILGESGTGKELFAHSIHSYSKRNSNPFVPLNFSALPESLAESELFGYTEGAFTGARKGGQAGLFELAHRGTIFLDEIGDASLNIQSRLLRILEENRVRRIGGSKFLPVDVRVIAATNKDLRKLINDGKFRADLYYRLHVLTLAIPPLRERKEDIPLLIDWFCKKMFNPPIYLPDTVKEILYCYRWSGNIRQLQNTLQFLGTKLKQYGPVPGVIQKILQEYLSDEITDVGEENKLDDEMLIYGYLEEYQAILDIMINANKKGQGMGRYSILRAAVHQVDSLTDARVRKMLNVLQRIGYVQTGKSRQGTWITTEGVKFFHRLKKGI